MHVRLAVFSVTIRQHMNDFTQMRRGEILYLRYLDDLSREIQNRFMYRAALAISVDVTVVTKRDMDVWERACMSG